MKTTIITAILYSLAFKLFSQETETKKQPLPINITILHGSLSLPFISSPTKYKFNPALLIGTEYLCKKKNNQDLHLSLNLGYYFHREWESTLFSEIRLGYRYSLKRFSISSDIGVGYSHIFTPKSIYKFEDGQFQKVNDKGSPAFQTSFSLIPSFKLSQKDNSTEIYISYTFTAQLPNNNTRGFHQFIGVGCKFYPF